MNINQQIEMLESKIDAIKADIESKQIEIDNFEYEISESDFDEFQGCLTHWIAIITLGNRAVR